MGKGMVMYLKSVSQWFLYILREARIDLFVLCDNEFFVLLKNLLFL